MAGKFGKKLGPSFFLFSLFFLTRAVAAVEKGAMKANYILICPETKLLLSVVDIEEGDGFQNFSRQLFRRRVLFFPPNGVKIKLLKMHLL